MRPRPPSSYDSVCGGRKVGVSYACVTAATCIATCATIEPIGFAVASAGIEMSVLPISGLRDAVLRGTADSRGGRSR